MSKLVAFAAIQGGYNVVSQVEGEYQRALDTFDADTKVGFPNTAYFFAGDLFAAGHQGGNP
jgi:acetyl-CoA synthase